MIICLSHLGWDWVWQRPQQILTRIAAHYPIVYINEPRLVPHDSADRLEYVARVSNLTAFQLVTRTPGGPGQWSLTHFEVIRDYMLDRKWLINDHLGLKSTRPLIGWFYSPMSVGILDQIPFDLIVYDIMDELANFKDAPVDMKKHEQRLLAAADLVFAGSPSLWEAKRGEYRQTHLFSSGVDANHFATATEPAEGMVSDLERVPRPIIGFYGVIDERTDLQLLDSIAALRPDWTWVVLGPVAKIEIADLPKRKAILYLGMKDYGELPAYLSAFDVAMMPFALNKATVYIKPTKLLEFMAAQKPIVSTPLKEVLDIGSPAISVAATPAEFVARVEAALNETPEEKAARIEAQARLVLKNSWDNIVESMRLLIIKALIKKGYYLAAGNLDKDGG